MRNGQDDDLLRAIKAIARVAGYDLLKVSAVDDLKNRTLSIALRGTSAGWVQESLDFEMEGFVSVDPAEPPPLEVTVDRDQHVEKVEVVGQIEDEETGEVTTITRHTPEEIGDTENPGLEGAVGEVAAMARRGRRG